MATAAHLPTKLMKAQGSQTSGQAMTLGSDTLMGLWVKAGSGAPSFNSTGIQYVADITGTNAEDTNIGSRVTLSSVTWAFDGSGTAVDLSCANIVYTQNGSDDGLSRYFVIYDSSVGSGDSSHPVLYCFDPGATVSVATSSYTMTSPTGGFVQFTGGG